MLQEPEIDPRKFVEYSMNPSHPDNRGKWMAFAALGYDVQSTTGRNIAAQNIIDQLRQSFPTSESTSSTPGKTTIWGVRFQLRIKIQGLNGRQGDLITNWQIDQDKNTPRLITNWLEVYQEQEPNYES